MFTTFSPHLLISLNHKWSHSIPCQRRNAPPFLLSNGYKTMEKLHNAEEASAYLKVHASVDECISGSNPDLVENFTKLKRKILEKMAPTKS